MSSFGTGLIIAVSVAVVLAAVLIFGVVVAIAIEQVRRGE